MSVQQHPRANLAMEQAAMNHTAMNPATVDGGSVDIHVRIAFARSRLVDALLAQTCAAANALRRLYTASADDLLNQSQQAGSKEHVSR